uniref:Uncharacterized protein n=1 Tax=Arundo donax TaxID=35708 RepID=A0A0A9BD52_ARUDO
MAPSATGKAQARRRQSHQYRSPPVPYMVLEKRRLGLPVSSE